MNYKSFFRQIYKILTVWNIPNVSMDLIGGHTYKKHHFECVWVDFGKL